MITATRRWLRRNRTNFAIGFGVLGVGYVASQYVLSKITEARERMSSDRIAREKYIHLEDRMLHSANINTFQSSAPVPTEPRGLHLHCTRTSPYSNREYPRSFAGGEHNARVTAEEGGKALKKQRARRTSTLTAKLGTA